MIEFSPSYNKHHIFTCLVVLTWNSYRFDIFKMKISKLYKTPYSIYPGQYVPAMNEDEIKKLISKTHKKKINRPPVNIIELADLFKIEIAVPGMQREEFLVQLMENFLHIYAVHKEHGINGTENSKQKEFNYEVCESEITLPENVDTEFISAEYKAGILRFLIPKAKHFRKNLRANIIVY